MKKKIFSALATGCLLALMMAVPARAQMPGTRIHVNIPFDFIVRGKTLPAGNYEIRRISDAPDGLIIRNVNENRDQVIFETEAVETVDIPNRDEIVFRRYGDSYFLSEVLTGGEETGRELAPSRSERRLIREMASNNAEPETVALAVY
jgi:hypothetical protein